MKILFWNTNRNVQINPYIASLVADNSIDILVLAEYRADFSELEKLMSSMPCALVPYVTEGCTRIKIFGDYRQAEPCSQGTFYSIQSIKNEYILCGTHLPSDLNGDSEFERCEIIREIMDEVHNIEADLKSDKTIIVGDFNEMPYSVGCLGASTFHGLPMFEKGAKVSRTIKGKEYRKYYNPMWNLFGDFSFPPGTYYRSDSTIFTPMWHMLDQFIIGRGLVPSLKKDDLKIITTCSLGSLMNCNRHPNKNISDHFPIMCGFMD